VGAAYLTDFTIGYGAVAGQGKCFGNLSKPEGNPGHRSKFGMASIEAVELFGNVADLFFPAIHSYKPNLQV
jgi:hypothetical protein